MKLKDFMARQTSVDVQRAKQIKALAAENKSLKEGARIRPGAGAITKDADARFGDLADDGATYDDGGHVVIGLSAKERKRFSLA